MARKMPAIPLGLKPKDLVGIPWRVAFALQADGWWLRSDIIWNKPNCMPESVRDRPTTSHEHVFLLTKSARYFWDQEAVREESARPDLMDKTRNIMSASDKGRMTTGYTVQEGSDYRRGIPYCNPAGRNIRTVWTIPTYPYSEAHFATFAPALVEPMIKAGTSERGCCPQCGMAWRRVVERGRETTTEKVERLGKQKKGGTDGRRISQNLDYSGHHDSNVRQSTTIGWRPGCECYGGKWAEEFGGRPDEAPLDGIVVPCRVLDPFGGAMTTGLVADRLGRDATLIELSEDYCRMGYDRIKGDAPMLVDVRLEEGSNG
jgi:hypothetical protein